jgi:plasmid stabilization system protein ParE
MSFTVRYTDEAKADIFRNAHWWAKHHSLEQALRWESAVENQISALQEMPERHGVAPENDDFPYEIRQKVIGLGSRPRYRAVFAIKEQEVFILAVRAGEENRLAPDDVAFES